MTFRPVSQQVGNVKNNDASLIEPNSVPIEQAKPPPYLRPLDTVTLCGTPAPAIASPSTLRTVLIARKKVIRNYYARHSCRRLAIKWG
jgi:hypothetical protein